MDTVGRERALGATFALSSVMTPFFMGTVVGAIAAGEVPADGDGDPFSSWIGLLPLLTGALFVAAGAYLAAVFLIADARRAGEDDLAEYFRRRALIAAAVAGAIALAGVFALHSEARYVYDRLTSEGLPLVIVSAACGLGALLLLARGAPRGARPLAAGAVVAVIWGWGVGQFPYLLPTSLRITESAAPGPTLDAILIVFGVAALTVVPALLLLYTLTQRDVVGE
jgi:cytochrome d ubiquinol oxidase subunit II